MANSKLLHEAAELGDISILDSIAESPELLLLENMAGRNVLQTAFYAGKFDFIREIINKRLLTAKIIYTVSSCGYSFLDDITLNQMNNIEDIIKEIIIIGNQKIANTNFIIKSIEKKQAYTKNLNQQDAEGETPLCLAAKNGNVKSFMALIQLGANLSVTNSHQQTPLHVAAKYNQPKIIEQLLTHPEIINSDILNKQDEAKNTILHLLLMYPNRRETNIPLAEKLVMLGASPSLKNENHYTPKMFLLRDGIYLDPNKQKILINKINELTSSENFKISEEELNRTRTTYELFFVFGGQKLIDRLGAPPEIFSGGTEEEVFNLLKSSFEDYTKVATDNNACHSSILNLLNNYQDIFTIPSFEQVADKILAGEPLFTTTGTLDHTVGATLERSDNQIILTLADRGLFMGTHSIKSLKFAADKILIIDVLKMLRLAHKEVLIEATNILYELIPSFTYSSYQNVNSIGLEMTGKMLKTGICYWANLKTIIHDWFIKTSNTFYEGQKDYKSYDIFLHKSVLENYKNTVPESQQNRELIKACEDIIQEKEKKFNNKFSGSNESESDVTKSKKFGV